MRRDSEDIGLAPTAHLAHSRASSVASISRSRRSSSDSSRRSSISESRQALTAAPAYVPDSYEGYRDASQRYSDRSYVESHDYQTPHHDTKHASTTNATEQFDVESEEHTKADEPVPWDDPRENSWVSKLAIPIAILVGLGLAGGTSYLVHARVQNLLANAAVDGDLAHWKRKAQYDVYDACYQGCTSCDDPNFAFNACKMTAQAVVKGANCDGNAMWNWRVEHRYPDACLGAVAKILMGEALESLKKSYRGQYGLLALTIIGGLIAGFITFKLLRCATMAPAERRATKSSFGKSAKNIAKASGKRAGTTNGKKLFTVLLGLFSARGARAVVNYPCAGRDPAWFQFFQSPDLKIGGVVHGWFSECHDKQECHKKCKNTCTTNSSGVRTCKDTCHDECTKVVVVGREPRVFVDRVTPKVRACGFQLKDEPDGKQLVARIGNAGIEKNHWVKISVNGFNVTDPNKTDEMIMCLHRIGDSTTL
ncbi:hypothetical protein B0T16DRAFT_447771 [Cercophora newfieldiana]|uniref:Uncharacterized protein n=1 Tax=Cercophora newfieldiana TaxID=92897 RepID=A0AA39Y3Q7_9PEZI|nr:hypothetical protein B0T16DRAFT_447771 [Cercophora newfieldiana]